jgi:hypothetical protein
MTDPRNVAHDKRVKREKKHHGAYSPHAPTNRPGMKPHQPPPSGHEPDESIESIESIDQTESVERH